MTPEACTWRLGIDVGHNSVGLAAIKYDGSADPVEVLAAVSHIHDAGRDPNSTAGESRKATGGVARRVRRLRSRRKERLAATHQILSGLGFTPPPTDAAHTWEPWEARARLIHSYIIDERERKELLGLALMHMAHFRGWRNPWSSIAVAESLETPSESLRDMIEGASALLGPGIDPPRTVGELGRLASQRTGTRVRPRVSISSEASVKQSATEESGIENRPLLFRQIRQEDLIYELRLICEMQELDDQVYTSLRDTIFKAARPSVPVERVGKDPFDPSERRALRASLEFQEFRIRDKVGNLRLVEDGSKVPLPAELHHQFCELLLHWQRPEPPTWLEVAEIFGIAEASLVTDEETGPIGAKAPTDRTTVAILEWRKKLPMLVQWWEDASRALRADLISFIADPVDVEMPEEIEELLESLSEEERTQLEALDLQSGRSAYGRTTLMKLNRYMEDNQCGLDHAVRMVFDREAGWQPPKASFDEQTGQPVVDRNLAIIRRFLSTATSQWGLPERVIVEHSRDAFLGEVAIAEIKRVQGKRRRINQDIRSELVASGIAEPSRRDIQKRNLLHIQGSCCLYCGATIEWTTTEIDHIVPRAEGGSNRQSNLAAVCRRCNAEKGRRPFASWAETAGRPDVSLQGALDRISQWQRLERQLDAKQFRNYQADVRRRLKRTTSDEELDQRSMESTAYAAVATRERIQRFLEDRGSGEIPVLVFNGRVNSLARKASGIGPLIKLRGENAKTRLDRRHHAIDAAVLTTLQAEAARVLVQRDDRYASAVMLGTNSEAANDFTGVNTKDQAIYGRWRQRAQKLAGAVAKAIHDDRVVVMNPHRLNPRIGRLHEATIQAFRHKDLGDVFSAAEIRRVIDRRVYRYLFDSLDGSTSLGRDDERSVRDDSGRLLTSQSQIDFYPLNGAAMLPTQGGAVELGFVHHARIYAWRNKKGKMVFGMVRVFGGEFGRIGFTLPGIDLLTAPLPTWSESWRLTAPNVLEAIESYGAKLVGWLATGDEIEFSSVDAVPGRGEISSFLKEFPDTRWSVEGFPQPSKLRLRPLYLAGEGLAEDAPRGVSTIIVRPGWLPSVDVTLSDPGITVVRRTALGRPRWNSNHLPSCWHPRAAAVDALG